MLLAFVHIRSCMHNGWPAGELSATWSCLSRLSVCLLSDPELARQVSAVGDEPARRAASHYVNVL